MRVDIVVQTRVHIATRRLWWADGLIRTLIVARKARTRVHPRALIRVHMWWRADGHAWHAWPIVVVRGASIWMTHGAGPHHITRVLWRAAIDTRPRIARAAKSRTAGDARSREARVARC